MLSYRIAVGEADVRVTRHERLVCQMACSTQNSEAATETGPPSAQPRAPVLLSAAHSPPHLCPATRTHPSPHRVLPEHLRSRSQPRTPATASQAQEAVRGR